MEMQNFYYCCTPIGEQTTTTEQTAHSNHKYTYTYITNIYNTNIRHTQCERQQQKKKRKKKNIIIKKRKKNKVIWLSWSGTWLLAHWICNGRLRSVVNAYVCIIRYFILCIYFVFNWKFSRLATRDRRPWSARQTAYNRILSHKTSTIALYARTYTNNKVPCRWYRKFDCFVSSKNDH